jgi:hypothetical protein
MQQSDDRCPHEHTAHHQFSRLGTAFRVAVKSGRVRSGARIITDNASSPALTRAASVLSRRQKERLRHSLQLSRSSRTNLHTKTDEQRLSPMSSRTDDVGSNDRIAARGGKRGGQIQRSSPEVRIPSGLMANQGVEHNK